MSDSAFHSSAYKGELNLIRSRINDNHEDPQALDADMRTPLHWAAASGQAPVVEYLIGKCPAKKYVNARDDGNTTALMCATAAGHVDVVKLLLSAGADPLAENASAQTALHLHKCRPPILEALLPHYTKPVINSKDKNGSTPLHRCVSGQSEAHQRCVELLLSAGAALSAQDGLGNTPLHLACEEELNEMVPLLGPSKGLFNVRNKEGKTPVEVSSARMQRALLEYLEGLK